MTTRTITNAEGPSWRRHGERRTDDALFEPVQGGYDAEAGGVTDHVAVAAHRRAGGLSHHA